MYPSHFDAFCVHRFDDAGQFAEAEPVRGFNVFEAQLADFIANGAAVFVPEAVPAGGKYVHVGILEVMASVGKLFLFTVRADGSVSDLLVFISGLARFNEVKPLNVRLRILGVI